MATFVCTRSTVCLPPPEGYHSTWHPSTLILTAPDASGRRRSGANLITDASGVAHCAARSTTSRFRGRISPSLCCRRSRSEAIGADGLDSTWLPMACYPLRMPSHHRFLFGATRLVTEFAGALSGYHRDCRGTHEHTAQAWSGPRAQGTPLRRRPAHLFPDH